MQNKIYMPAALLILLAGCNMDEGKAKKAPQKAGKTDSPAVKMQPVEQQDAPEKGQYCDIVKVYDKDGATWIDADYVQFLMGNAGLAAAKKHGEAEMDIDKKGDTTWGLPDGYYILNENKKLRSLKLADEVAFIGVEGITPAPPAKLTVKYLQSIAKDNLFILTFNDSGEVFRIKQQFIP
jgi:hypothetical protein